ncbi:MAG: hypothetical protein AAB609_01550 [Patescibacteria group bacterium]
MEQKSKPSTPEERASAIADLFRDELKKISDKLEKARALNIDVETRGDVRRKPQEILHLKERETELVHDRGFVLGVLANTPTQTSGIGDFFAGKLDEIDLEIKRTEAHPSGVIFDEGPIRGKKQALHHLSTIRADMLRAGNHVLGVLGQPPLADKKNPQHKT